MSLLTHAEIKKYMEMAPKASPDNRAKIQALLEMDKIVNARLRTQGAASDTWCTRPW